MAASVDESPSPVTPPHHDLFGIPEKLEKFRSELHARTQTGLDSVRETIRETTHHLVDWRDWVTGLEQEDLQTAMAWTLEKTEDLRSAYLDWKWRPSRNFRPERAFPRERDLLREAKELGGAPYPPGQFGMHSSIPSLGFPIVFGVPSFHG